MKTTTISPSVYYFGTPVALITTLTTADGSTNITPISSAWALDGTYVLGIGRDSQAVRNLHQCPELVINLPDASQVEAIEAIAPTTGSPDIPVHKVGRYRHEPDKWRLGGFSARRSDLVRPDRIAQCPVQIEARVSRFTPLDDGDDVVIAHAQVVRTHAHAHLVLPGSSHIDLETWRPVYSTFRHYFSQGEAVGVNFRAEQ
ncbi:flavin reductase (DIM6/NTAB) family NADH-FMN oxidoreductase RutF [Brevibacterium sanguinis]|uniref:Flavin reductase (DIM6/NTAB) family NADH-FMN oxidoreductase RutF n=2 Tax=Brevibacterium TaxID=1696 RepID=A0A366IK95_9MICO|nr:MULTISPECIES: flavin reductase [Brevibacterium]RBP66202.1 flavin reductase (DIM6/NTAB) family NADH-FMN oxidoreductase RutF [Brevibacterium sanguinis]RBP72853.1 flavin reductase (DIM6/NTAB) family NADH-FMN oxidoreductase RutF [Brevibacterium celere]